MVLGLATTVMLALVPLQAPAQTSPSTENVPERTGLAAEIAKVALGLGR